MPIELGELEGGALELANALIVGSAEGDPSGVVELE